MDQIRRWRRVGVLSLLWLALPGFTLAQTETTTPPSKPAQTAPTKKSRHRTSSHPIKKQAATSTSAHASAKKGAKNSRGKRLSKKRGQQVIDSARAREIQEALIREHYLDGEPSGSWDAATQVAMQRYQTDQGWQSKTIPDSRALIKLGLGPSTDHLLNPESAMTSSSAPAANARAANPSVANASAAGANPKAAPKPDTKSNPAAPGVSDPQPADRPQQ